MTTVVLTPTHMACDHNFIDNTYPRKSRTSLSDKKIFVDPKKKFMLGLSGDYIQSDVDHEETYRSFALTIAELCLVQKLTGHTVGIAQQSPKAARHIVEVVGEEAQILVATKMRRFVLFYFKERKAWATKKCGEFVGIGSGGSYAIGLLHGGMAIKDIWKPLSQIDTHTSVEHTLVPLSVLKLWNMRI